MKKLLGTKNGKKVYATYSHDSGSLPELKVESKKWRGSSLGPANPNADSSDADVDYWKSIAKQAKLID